MAILLRKEKLHERVYCGRWEGRIVFLFSFRHGFEGSTFIFFKDTFRMEEARSWDAQVSFLLTVLQDVFFV